VPSTLSCRAKQASVPGSGGTIETGPFFPVIETWIVNVPLGDALMLTDFTAPCSPLASL
jgi:hypothetical protein